MSKAVTQEMAGHAPDLSGYGPHEGMLLLADDETSTLAQKIAILKEGVKLDKSNWFFTYGHEEPAGTGSNIHGGLQMGKAWLDADTETAASDKFLIVYTDGLGYLWAAPDGTPRTTYSQFALDNAINVLGYGPSSFRSANGMPNADQRVAQNKYYEDGSDWIPAGIDVERFGPAFVGGASLVPNMEALLASANPELTGDGPYQVDTLFEGFAFSIATNDSTAPIRAHPIENATAANGFAADRMAPYRTYYEPDPAACKDVPYLESTPYVVVEQGGKYYYANVDHGDGTYSYDADRPDGMANYFVNSNFFMLHPTSIEKGVYMLGKAYEDALSRGYHCALFWENNTANNRQFVMGEAFKQWAREKSEYECQVGASAADITAVFAKMNTAMAYLLARGTVSDEIPGYFELVMDGEGEPGSERPFMVCLDGAAQQVVHVPGTMTWSFGTPNESNEYPYVVTYEPRTSTTERCSSRFVWAINVPVEKAAPVQLCYKLALTDVDWALEVARDGDGKIPTNGDTTLACSDSNGRRHATRFEVPDVGAVTTNSSVTYVWSGPVPPGHSVPVDTNLYPIYGPFPADTNYTASTVVDGTYEFSGWSDPSTDVMLPGGVVLSGTWTRVVSEPIFAARMRWTPEVADASGLFYGRLDLNLLGGNPALVSNAWFVYADRDNDSASAGFDLPYYSYLMEQGLYATNFANAVTFPDQDRMPGELRYVKLDETQLHGLDIGEWTGYGLSEEHLAEVPVMPTHLVDGDGNNEALISTYILDCVPPQEKVVPIAEADYLADLVVSFVWEAGGKWFCINVIGDPPGDIWDLEHLKTYYEGPFEIPAPVGTQTATVTLDANGGTIPGAGSSESLTATNGLPMPASQKPTKSGYTFEGYYDDAGGRYYDADMNSSRNWDGGTADQTLTARWTRTVTTKITLDPNGGTAGTKTVTATKGSPMPAATAPTKTGCQLVGFFTLKKDGVKYYNSDMSSANKWPISDATYTLYAHWKTATAKITLDPNGGTGGTASVTATYGSALPSATAPTRTGYVFQGYYTATSGGSMYYDASMKSQVTWKSVRKSYTLYARWKAKTAKVAFNANGGTLGTASASVTYDKSLPAITPPTRSGYAFLGYYNKAEGGSQYWKADGTGARLWNGTASSYTFYAHWARVSTVTINKAGGTSGTSKVIVTNGVMPRRIGVPTREGYTLLGIFNKAEGGAKYWNADGTPCRVWNGTAATYTFYAQWMRAPVGLTAKVGGELAPDEAEAAMALFDGDEETGWMPAGAATDWDLVATYAEPVTAVDLEIVEDAASSEDMWIDVSEGASSWSPLEAEEDLPATFQYLWLHFEDAGGVAPHLYEITVTE